MGLLQANVVLVNTKTPLFCPNFALVLITKTKMFSPGKTELKLKLSGAHLICLIK